MPRSFVWLKNGMFGISLRWTRETFALTGFTGVKVLGYGRQNNSRPSSFKGFSFKKAAKKLNFQTWRSWRLGASKSPCSNLLTIGKFARAAKTFKHIAKHSPAKNPRRSCPKITKGRSEKFHASLK